MIKNITFILVLLFSNSIFSQYNFKNKKELAIFNIVSSGIVGGLGALFNSNDTHNGFKSFVKGFYKGSISGLVMYSGKELMSNFPKTNNYMYFWGSKALVYTSASMLENTVNHKKLFEDLHYNIGFIRFNINTTNFNIKPKIMPVSMSISLWLSIKYQIDYKLSLKTGNFIFTGKRKNNLAYGTTYGNNILISQYSSKYPENLVLAHEMIHVFQLNFFSCLDTYYYKAENKIFNTNSEFYKKYKNYFYMDYNNVSFLSSYSFFSLFYNKKHNNYEKNIFESEAFYFMNK